MTPEQVKDVIDALQHVCIGLSVIGFWLFCIFVVQYIRLTREK